MKGITPNRRLRIVQIGFGHIGMRRTLLTHGHPRIDVAGVVDIKHDRLALARDILGEECILGTDYLQVLQNVRPDGAIVSTPNDLHAPMTLNALAMGVHILCEKPLAINAAMAERCVAFARRKRLKLKVGSNHRFWRGVREIMELVQGGTIGEVRHINTEIGYLLPDVRSEWYREEDHSGGGTIIDNCPHLLDVVSEILRISGGDRITGVECATTRDTHGFEVEDRAEGVLFSAKGRTVNLMSTWSEGDYRMNLEIQGSRGRLVLSGFDQLTLETQQGVTLKSFDDVPATESWEMDIQAFVDALLFNADPMSSGEEGLRCVRIIDALYRSAQSHGKEVVGGGGG